MSSFKTTLAKEMSGTRSPQPGATPTASDVREFQRRFKDGMRALELVSGSEGAPFRLEVRSAIDNLHQSLWGCDWLTRVSVDRHVLSTAIEQLHSLQVEQDRADGVFDGLDSQFLTGEENVDVQQVRDAQFRLQSCWFLGRYVSLIARTVFPGLVPNKQKRRDRRSKFIDASDDYLVAGRLLLTDAYLLDRMSPSAVKHLHELLDGVDSLSRHLAEVLAQPVDPFANGSASESGDRRELILDLADCCFRTFRHCTPDVLRSLLDTHDIADHYRRDDTLKSLIGMALDRKQENVVRREDVSYVIARTHAEAPWKAGVWLPHLVR